MILKKLEDLDFQNYLEIESNDEQFLAIKKLTEIHWVVSLSYIIANALICYQLSSTGELYWEEFYEYFKNKKITDPEVLIEELKVFISKSKWNKRLVNIKTKRLDKTLPLLKELIWKEEYYYENMLELQDLLAKKMNQKKWDKTIVFAIKMFGYWARIAFQKVINYPFEINIPIDSRLIAIHEQYGTKNESIEDFYIKLSKKVNIPPLHLDAVLWVNYKNLISK